MLHAQHKNADNTSEFIGGISETISGLEILVGRVLLRFVCWLSDDQRALS
jgi:hypothetical protein